jgi:hypothetical protein
MWAHCTPVTGGCQAIPPERRRAWKQPVILEVHVQVPVALELSHVQLLAVYLILALGFFYLP